MRPLTTALMVSGLCSGISLNARDTGETYWDHRIEPLEYLRSLSSEVSKDPPLTAGLTPWKWLEAN